MVAAIEDYAVWLSTGVYLLPEDTLAGVYRRVSEMSDYIDRSRPEKKKEEEAP